MLLMPIAIVCLVIGSVGTATVLLDNTRASAGAGQERTLGQTTTRSAAERAKTVPASDARAAPGLAGTGK